MVSVVEILKKDGFVVEKSERTVGVGAKGRSSATWTDVHAHPPCTHSLHAPAHHMHPHPHPKPPQTKKGLSTDLEGIEERVTEGRAARPAYKPKMTVSLGKSAAFDEKVAAEAAAAKERAAARKERAAADKGGSGGGDAEGEGKGDDEDEGEEEEEE
jgi:hypothetical protein